MEYNIKYKGDVTENTRLKNMNILKIITDIIKMFGGFLFGLMKIIAVAVAPIVIITILFYVYYRYIKKIKPPEGKKGKVKRIGHLKRLFYLFPQRFVLDTLNRNPEEFTDYGVHIIAGEQGAGKTITMAYLLNQYKQIYPKIKIRSNFGYKLEDEPITDYKTLIANNNGMYGQIEVIDELQNWFSSLESKDFPPEMLREITQQRKQYKMILSSSQVFSRCAKPIREQCTFLYEPITLFKCLTFVRVSKPRLDADGAVKKKRTLKIFYFVHDDIIRSQFDTRKQIEYLQKGFKPRSEHLSYGKN